MEIRWSPRAADDLEHIFKRIEPDNPSAARQVVKTIYEGCAA
jgi:plasmid stabilization system protein ParE